MIQRLLKKALNNTAHGMTIAGANRKYSVRHTTSHGRYLKAWSIALNNPQEKVFVDRLAEATKLVNGVISKQIWYWDNESRLL